MRRTSSFWRRTSMPSRSMEPESGSCSVATVRISVLLPAPLGPTSPNILLPIDSERFFSAFTPSGYVFESPAIVSAILYRQANLPYGLINCDDDGACHDQ